MLAVGLLSGRSKMYGFFVLAMFIVFYINAKFELKFNVRNITVFIIAAIAIVAVAWTKIHFYFIEGAGVGEERGELDYYARAALYYFSLDIFRDYFPFGSGFATYGTYASGEYYSHIYNDFGMDIMQGLTERDPRFIADTYYPALAQFGIVGVILFFSFWILQTKKILSLYAEKYIKEFAIGILIVFFFLIECTSDATITHNRGLFLMMLLALVITDMQRTILSKTK